MNTAFGPWTTSMNDRVGPQLRTYWKRRLAMLSTMTRGRGVLTRKTGWLLAIAGAAICAVPTPWYSPVRADDDGQLKDYYQTTKAIDTLLVQHSELANTEPGDAGDRDKKLEELERKLEELLDKVRALRASARQRPEREMPDSRVFTHPAGLDIRTVGDGVEVRAEAFVGHAVRVSFNHHTGGFVFEGNESGWAELWRSGPGNNRDVTRGHRIFYWPKDGSVKVEGMTAINTEPRDRADTKSSSRKVDAGGTAAWQLIGLELDLLQAEKLGDAGRHLRGGMKVLGVRTDSAAEQSGIRDGDILVGLERWETVTHDNVAWILTRAKTDGRRSLTFHVLRAGEVVTGLLRLPDDQ